MFGNARQIIAFFRGDGVISDPGPPIEQCELLVGYLTPPLLIFGWVRTVFGILKDLLP